MCCSHKGVIQLEACQYIFVREKIDFFNLGGFLIADHVVFSGEEFFRPSKTHSLECT